MMDEAKYQKEKQMSAQENKNRGFRSKTFRSQTRPTNSTNRGRLNNVNTSRTNNDIRKYLVYGDKTDDFQGSKYSSTNASDQKNYKSNEESTKNSQQENWRNECENKDKRNCNSSNRGQEQTFFRGSNRGRQRSNFTNKQGPSKDSSDTLNDRKQSFSGNSARDFSFPNGARRGREWPNAVASNNTPVENSGWTAQRNSALSPDGPESNEPIQRKFEDISITSPRSSILNPNAATFEMKFTDAHLGDPISYVDSWSNQCLLEEENQTGKEDEKKENVCHLSYQKEQSTTSELDNCLGTIQNPYFPCESESWDDQYSAERKKEHSARLMIKEEPQSSPSKHRRYGGKKEDTNIGNDEVENTRISYNEELNSLTKYDGWDSNRISENSHCESECLGNQFLMEKNKSRMEHISNGQEGQKLTTNRTFNEKSRYCKGYGQNTYRQERKSFRKETSWGTRRNFDRPPCENESRSNRYSPEKEKEETHVSDSPRTENEANPSYSTRRNQRRFGDSKKENSSYYTKGERNGKFSKNDSWGRNGNLDKHFRENDSCDEKEIEQFSTNQNANEKKDQSLTHGYDDRGKYSNSHRRRESSDDDYRPRRSTEEKRRSRPSYEFGRRSIDTFENLISAVDDDPDWRDFVNFWENKDREITKVVEEDKDLFTVEKDYSLGHCVAEDMLMGSGIAVKFRSEFHCVDELLDQNKKAGELAILERKEEERFIYYMVTKRRSSGKPTYADFWRSLVKMRDHVKDNNVKKLALPKIGCGLDRLDWKIVKPMLQFLFEDVDVELLVCSFQPEEISNHNDSITKKNTKKYCKVVTENYPITSICKGTIILYFTSREGEMTETMSQLNEKFNFYEELKKKLKKVGEPVRFDTRNGDYVLYGCIIKEKKEDLFGFVHLNTCLKIIQKNNRAKDQKYEYIGFQKVPEDEENMMNVKILNIMKHSLVNFDIYCCGERKDDNE